MSHDSSILGRFTFLKTLAHLEQFRWKRIYLDVLSYCKGILVCQQEKNNHSKPFGEPSQSNFPHAGEVLLRLVLLPIYPKPKRTMTPLEYSWIVSLVEYTCFLSAPLIRPQSFLHPPVP